MSLGDWLLLLSTLLAGAVLLGTLTRRANLPLTVVLALVGFLTGWLGNLQSPISNERFEDVLVFIFLPVLVFEAALGLSTRAFFRSIVPISAELRQAALKAAGASRPDSCLWPVCESDRGRVPFVFIVR